MIMSSHPYLVNGRRYSLLELEKNVGGSHQHGIMYAATPKIIMAISHGDKRVRKDRIRYNDRWNEDKTIYYYHGSGDKADQDPEDAVRGNRQLRDSIYNGTPVFLFIESENNMYELIGEVKVISEPTYELNPDTGFKRLVFPLALYDGFSPVVDDIDIKVKKIFNISNEKLIREVSKEKTPKLTKTSTYQYSRDEYVRLYALRRAGDNCQLCLQKAPFSRSDGSPYLEVHHIVPLSQGGSDSIDNVCALCPNCHRKMHIIADSDDVSKLLKTAEKRL